VGVGVFVGVGVGDGVGVGVGVLKSNTISRPSLAASGAWALNTSPLWMRRSVDNGKMTTISPGISHFSLFCGI
jgi:hypothetical protein